MARSPIHSPTSSLSSFSMLSPPSRSATLASLSDDEDQIVFSPRLSSSSHSSLAQFYDWNSDDDFILIPSPVTTARSPPASIISGLAGLSLDSAAAQIPISQPTSAPAATPLARATPLASQAQITPPYDEPSPATPTIKSSRAKPALSKRSSSAARSYPSPSPSPPASDASPSSRKAKSKLKHRPRSNKVRERAAAEAFVRVSVELDDYQDAVDYVSSFLSNPAQAATQQRLPLLQALIVELGLCVPASSALPTSVNTAKALLRSKAHINIRDYVAARGRGLDALQEVMFPTRSQLNRDLRQRRVPINWVKEHGLTMLLVSMF